MQFRLLDKKDKGEGIWSFFFEPDKKFSYEAGQYVYLTLSHLTHPDARGATRHFTLSSSPTEKVPTITTIVRPESGFKQTLAELAIGETIEADGPHGEFFLSKPKTTPQVFIAGGIGITPFRSIVKYQIDQKYQTPMTLIYSAATPKRLTFKDEFDQWAKQVENFTVDYSITKPELASSWKGKVGRVDKRFFSQYDFSQSDVWVCGPPVMVQAMETLLGPISKRVLSEKFTGY